VSLDDLGPLVVGFLGSFHCLGMCGPIVMAYSLQLSPAGTAAGGPGIVRFAALTHHAAFHGGRIFSYTILGGLAGILAQGVNVQRFFMDLRGGMSLLAGVVMVGMGLVLLRFLPFPSTAIGSKTGVAGLPARWISRFVGSRGIWGKAALGVATGFLPCMLPWAMVVKATTTSGMGEALATMLLFGLGTVPALLLLGLSSSAISMKFRLLGDRIAASSVIVMGAILAFKGARALVRMHLGA
jgi:uncharacterized protein